MKTSLDGFLISSQTSVMKFASLSVLMLSVAFFSACSDKREEEPEMDPNPVFHKHMEADAQSEMASVRPVIIEQEYVEIIGESGLVIPPLPKHCKISTSFDAIVAEVWIRAQHDKAVYPHIDFEQRQVELIEAWTAELGKRQTNLLTIAQDRDAMNQRYRNEVERQVRWRRTDEELYRDYEEAVRRLRLKVAPALSWEQRDALATGRF